jgi:DNA polymerase-4
MFCAVARLVDPDGAGQAPLLIVGGRSGSRGVVCSASYEVRAFGVRSGMPIRQAERLCPAAVFAPVPRDAVGQKSREIRAVLEEWAPVVEPSSVDEFYLGLDGTEALYRHEPLEVTAIRIREDLLRRTGLPVSFGGGTNRLIAKLAVEVAKPRPGTAGNGVFVVPPGMEAAFVADLELTAFPGVGPRMTETLRRKGLVMVRDALGFDRATLGRWFGARTGAWLFDRLRGISNSPVRERVDAKSVSRESTFPHDLVTDGDLDAELVRLTEQVCHDLRTTGLLARTITLRLRDHDYRTRQAARTLRGPVCTERVVLPVARELMSRLRAERRVAARLIGVALSQLAPADRPVQLGLFSAEPDGPESGRDRLVAETADRIRERFGQDAIGPGRAKRGTRTGERPSP